MHHATRRFLLKLSGSLDFSSADNEHGAVSQVTKRIVASEKERQFMILPVA